MGRFLRISNGVARSFDEAAAPTVYDEVYVVGPSGLAAGTPITLPSSGTYENVELKVYLNGQRTRVGEDYDYVGAGPTRTQIEFTFDLLKDERVRFVKE